jgi:hypothetical protein
MFGSLDDPFETFVIRMYTQTVMFAARGTSV